MPYSQLIYRGNYALTARIDFAGTMLSVEYGGGFREDEVIFPPMRGWSLNYSALSKRVHIQLRDGERASRLNYIWNFYVASKAGGNLPFVVRCPRDEKLYLAYFPDDALEMTMVDNYLATTGLALRQTSVRGVAVNADGSVDEDVIDPDAI